MVTTADGRPLRVDHADLPGGFPVLVHAGSPGSRRMLGAAVELAATAFGLRLISYGRGGGSPTLRRTRRRLLPGSACRA